ncbi:hypothetical protein AC249_AIPGENE28738, partial [Exaiptasia diaphana]
MITRGSSWIPSWVLIVASSMSLIVVEKQNNDSRRFDPDAKCPHNEVLYNVKLKAGLHAGKFTDIGKVKSIMTCVRYCCDSKAKSNVDCDLAFMLKDRCYLVKCFSEDRCQALPA